MIAENQIYIKLTENNLTGRFWFLKKGEKKLTRVTIYAHQDKRFKKIAEGLNPEKVEVTGKPYTYNGDYSNLMEAFEGYNQKNRVLDSLLDILEIEFSLKEIKKPIFEGLSKALSGVFCNLNPFSTNIDSTETIDKNTDQAQNSGILTISNGSHSVNTGGQQRRSVESVVDSSSDSHQEPDYSQENGGGGSTNQLYQKSYSAMVGVAALGHFPIY